VPRLVAFMRAVVLGWGFTFILLIMLERKNAGWRSQVYAFYMFIPYIIARCGLLRSTNGHRKAQEVLSPSLGSFHIPRMKHDAEAHC
jgi:hypothetical protein